MKSEQAQRLENAKENIKAAQLLQKNGYFDIAVTRAYYAMLYTAEALLLEKGLTFGQHEPVINHFNELFARDLVILRPYHRYLVEGYDARIEADYRPLTQATAAQAQQQIRRAASFLGVARMYLKANIAPIDPSPADSYKFGCEAVAIANRYT